VALENSATSFVTDTSAKTGRGESTIRKDAYVKTAALPVALGLGSATNKPQLPYAELPII
jgi:hypothetical protein